VVYFKVSVQRFPEGSDEIHTKYKSPCPISWVTFELGNAQKTERCDSEQGGKRRHDILIEAISMNQ
jgi:hypothetical protein